jgi:malonyl CoA-acyl carrier protein transacylase
MAEFCGKHARQVSARLPDAKVLAAGFTQGVYGVASFRSGAAVELEIIFEVAA